MMSSRNQNRPPRNPSGKKEGGDGVQLDKRRRIGTGRIGGPTGERKPFGAVNRRQDVSVSNEAENAECASIEFTKEEVEGVICEKIKLKKFDHKGNVELFVEQNNKLKNCLRFMLKKDEGHVEEEGRLRNALDLSEKKCAEMVKEMKKKEEMLNSAISELKKENVSLQDKLLKEELEKLDVIDRLKKENETRISVESLNTSLSRDLQQAQQDLLVANQRIASLDDMYKRLNEYNQSLQQYNSKLLGDLRVTRDKLNRIESEKLTIVQNLTTLRGHFNSLQDQLSTSKNAEDEAVRQKEALANEVRCLRVELQQVREDRERQVVQVQELTAEVVKCKEVTGKSFVELDNLRAKSKLLEDTCASQ